MNLNFFLLPTKFLQPESKDWLGTVWEPGAVPEVNVRWGSSLLLKQNI